MWSPLLLLNSFIQVYPIRCEIFTYVAHLSFFIRPSLNFCRRRFLGWKSLPYIFRMIWDVLGPTLVPIRFHSIPEKFEEFFSKKLLFFDVLLIPSWYRLETRKSKIIHQCPLVLGSYKALICINLVLRKLKIIHTMTPKNRKN